MKDNPEYLDDFINGEYWHVPNHESPFNGYGGWDDSPLI